MMFQFDHLFPTRKYDFIMSKIFQNYITINME